VARCLILPGLHDSGPDHWQTRWLASREDCDRVELGRWSEPSRTLWVSRLDRAVARTAAPVVLVAHSLACHAVAWWAADASLARLEKVRGALLVAPPDVDHPDALAELRPFAPTVRGRLPFRSILAASRDDSYASFRRLKWLAEQWGSEFADFGNQGHLNADSRLGDWTEGQQLLRSLLLQQPAPAVTPSARPRISRDSVRSNGIGGSA
jgi:predicted alpha/beta hydrolase family esterase